MPSVTLNKNEHFSKVSTWNSTNEVELRLNPRIRIKQLLNIW